MRQRVQLVKMIDVKRCPVCGNTSRQESSEGIASARGDSGRHYLKFAADKLQMPIEQLLDTIKVFQCDECRTFYCDPWISSETASYIFTDGAPDHMAGWGNFEHWLSAPCPNAVGATNQRLYQLVEERIGRLSAYAEYGCPFQGFLLLFRGMEVAPDQRIDLFSQAMKRSPDIRWSTSPRVYLRAQRIAGALTIGYHRLRLKKEAMRARAAEAISPCYPLPEKRTLLTQETTKRWGNNCVRYGGSCNYYSSRILGAEVLPFDEKLSIHTDGQPAEYDLIGIFNIIDHTNAPLEVLRSSLRLARHVVVVNHHASTAGKQHLFAFHHSFPNWLASTLKGVTVEDLSPFVGREVAGGYNFVLISRS